MTTSSSLRANSASRRVPRLVALPWLVLAGMALIAVGIGIGVLIMRARHSAQVVILSVNGHIISKAAFLDRVQSVAGPATLRAMVEDELHLEFAQQRGVAPDDRAVEARYALAAAQPGFAGRLAANHLSPALYKLSLRAQLASDAVITSRVQVTDAEVQRYYRSQIAKNNPTARYYVPGAMVIRIIVTGSEAQARQAEQALKSGVTFAEAAGRYSVDTSRTRGGLLAPFQRGRTQVSRIPGLEEAIFALKVGQQWGPRRLGNMWWLVHCEDKSLERIVPFAEVADDCRSRALMAKALPLNGKRVAAEYEEFKRKAIIQTFDPSYESVANAR